MCSQKNTKYRIVFFIGNMSHPGGTERVLSVIANGLSRRGFSVSIISMWGGGETFFPVDERIPIYWVEKERQKEGIAGNLRYVAELLERKKPDFLVDVDIILACYSIFMKWRMPEMCWISWEHFNYYYHFERNNLLRKIVRRVVARYSDQLVVLTDEDKGYYKKNLKLRCGLTRIYDPLPYEGSYHKEMEEHVIFAAGRLTEAKGFDLLIRSWAALESAYPQWKVLIAGEGDGRKELEKDVKASGLKRIKFIGNVSDIESYYQKAAFFVFPSREEGFGMTLLEAMSFSLPVISYDCKAGPKEMVVDGKNGFLVEEGNVEDFTRKMELLMTDKKLRRTMGERAGKTEPKFDRENILDEWEALLGRVYKK